MERIWFFPFNVDLFQKGLAVQESEPEVGQVVSFVKDAGKSSKFPESSNFMLKRLTSIQSQKYRSRDN